MSKTIGLDELYDSMVAEPFLRQEKETVYVDVPDEGKPFSKEGFYVVASPFISMIPNSQAVDRAGSRLGRQWPAVDGEWQSPEMWSGAIMAISPQGKRLNLGERG